MHRYALLRDGEVIGQYSPDELRGMADLGLLAQDDLIEHPKTGERRPVSSVLATEQRTGSRQRNASNKRDTSSGSSGRGRTTGITYALRAIGGLTLIVGILQITAPAESPIHFYLATPSFAGNRFIEMFFNYAGIAAVALGVVLLRTGILRGKAWSVDVAFGAIAISYLTAACLSFIVATGFSLVPSTDPFLTAVKSAMTEYCDRSVEDLTLGFMTSREWEVEVDPDGTRHVTVRGSISFNGSAAEAALRFKVGDDSPQLESTSIDNVELPKALARRLWLKMCATPGD